MPARGGESWQCENWLDQPYCPPRKPERRRGAMVTSIFTNDAFGQPLFLPLAHKTTDLMPGASDTLSSEPAVAAAPSSRGIRSSMASSAPSLSRVSMSGVSLGRGTRSMLSGPPLLSMSKASYVDMSAYSTFEKPETFKDLERAAVRQRIAEGSQPSLIKQSCHREGFQDYSGHKAALKPAETLWSKEFARRRDPFKKEPQLAAQHTRNVSEKTQSHRWFSEQEMADARSAPTMSKARGFVGGS